MPRSTRSNVSALLLALVAALQAAAALGSPVPAAAPTTGGISAAQARQVLEVLNDPKQRAAFTATLETIAKSLPAPAATPATTAKKIVVAPNSVASGLLGELGTVRTLGVTQADAFARMFRGGMLTARWLRGELADHARRVILVDAAWRGTLVFLGAVLAEQILARLLRRPLRRLARETKAAPEDLAADPPAADARAEPEPRRRDATHRHRTLRLLRRVPFALLRLLLKLLPVGLFLAISSFAAGSLAAHPLTSLIIVTVANLYATGRVLALALDTLLAPRAPGVRLIRMSDAGAALLSQWWAWLVAVPVVALTVTQVGGLLDLPARAAQAIIRAIVLVEHILLAILIWRVRGRVAAALTPPRRFRGSAAGVVLARMAQRWWIPALFFDFALWLVWAAQLQNGYARIWRLFLVTVAVVFACRLAATALLGLLERGFRLSDVERHYPGLEQRANRYYPLLRRVVNGAVLLTGGVLLLQAWGLDTLAWFTSGALGTRLVSALVSILVAMTLGIVVWEAANAALDRQVWRFGEAAQTTRAVRLQTLLPILRTVLFIVLAIVVGLTVLSEVGVNVAPLLAGAGILGVAIGFGSQKLVQDFITGIFLLVENAMQVGDTVTAAGVTGTVEHLSIRTLRLRGGDGSVQIIPFSSVSTVTNLSRDFAVAAISVSIAAGEDTDRVCALLLEIGAGLRTDSAFADLTLDDFALNGVDSIGEYAVAISGVMRCTVGGRWPVQREFYRRLNAALQQHQIGLPARPLALPQGSLRLESVGGEVRTHD